MTFPFDSIIYLFRKINPKIIIVDD